MADIKKEKLNVAVIGGGGREHAIISKLLQSPRLGTLCAIPGNGGIEEDVPCININASDVNAVAAYCIQNNIDYVVVTPDDPLALGMVDALNEAKISSFGPVKAAARIESSKIFSKNLMKKYGIPTAAYETFNDYDKAIEYVRKYFADGHTGIVIKADGLALGKGVTICSRLKDAEEAVFEAMKNKRFGASGENIVVEEMLEGVEVSVLAFCDGRTLVPMVSSMDHKRAFDGNTGPNTGGMGTIAPNPFWTAQIAADCEKRIFLPTVAAMQKEGAPFSGCLYFGLMLTKNGPVVIEYNCRFGDPETQVVLPLLETDLLEIMIACTEGRLDPKMVNFKTGAAVCVIMASGGYPAGYGKGYAITGIDEAEKDKCVKVYSAGTAKDPKNESLVTSGGRVLGVTATADTLKAAIMSVYKAVSKIHFKNCFYRTDIGFTTYGTTP
ncbi:phosphoribosylamine--glycine ligase [Spirochaetia bacterium]|nr:phosphoribosylamine--glycine ligase [Spirochaetia bacterium]